jgi:hypothetical protein
LPIFNTNITTNDAQSLCEALAKVGPNSELLEGIHFLGQPLGRCTYTAIFLNFKASEYSSASSRILDCLYDTQTQCALYKNCTHITTPHLLASDAYHHINLLGPPPLQTWTCCFLSSILSTNHHFLACLLNTLYLLPRMPSPSLPIRHQKGGLVSKAPQPMLLPHMLSPYGILVYTMPNKEYTTNPKTSSSHLIMLAPCVSGRRNHCIYSLFFATTSPEYLPLSLEPLTLHLVHPLNYNFFRRQLANTQ